MGCDKCHVKNRCEILLVPVWAGLLVSTLKKVVGCWALHIFITVLRHIIKDRFKICPHVVVVAGRFQYGSYYAVLYFNSCQ